MPPRRIRVPSTVGQLPARSRKPFAQALADLKMATGWGWRDFAEQVSSYGGPWSFAYLNHITVGQKVLGPGEPMWAICHAVARATGVEPTYFREYREHLAAQRAAQLATEIGLDEVLEVLDELKARQG